MVIASGAFGGCFNLTNVVLGNGIGSVGASAFSSCNHLATIILPATVTNLASGAFGWDSGLGAVFFRGNAPAAASDTFQGCTATVYYLPGTTNWGASFGGLPTAPWFLPHPLILSSPGFGVQTNGFGFVVSWATNLSVVTEAGTDLAKAIWSPVSTNALTNGWFYFSDPDWTNYSARLYRVRSP